MEFSAQQIADFLEGIIEGNPEIKVNKVSKIEEGTEGSLTFLANPQYTSYIYTTQASVVIVNHDFTTEKELKCTLIRVQNAYEGFAKLLELYNSYRINKSGIDAKAVVSETAKIGNNVYIGAGAYIGEQVIIGNDTKIYPNSTIGDLTKIGNNCKIFSGVHIYHECEIGNDCTVHSGSVIGADGFGFVPNSENNYQKVVQIGNVILEDYVEIGANSTIDRATLGSTIIRKGVKIDNLVQIAHNVEIGENTVIAAQSGIAGSTKIGKNCMIGGQVGIVGHIVIANGTKIAAQSGVGSNITREDTILQGSPAFEIADYRRSYVIFRKLPDLNNRLSQLERSQK